MQLWCQVSKIESWLKMIRYFIVFNRNCWELVESKYIRNLIGKYETYLEINEEMYNMLKNFKESVK